MFIDEGRVVHGKTVNRKREGGGRAKAISRKMGSEQKPVANGQVHLTV